MDFSKMFSDAPAVIMNAASKVLPIACGIPDSVLGSTNSRYVVTIHAMDKNYDLRVTAFLQDAFVFEVSSQWDGLPSIPGIKEIGEVVQTLIQGGTGQQLKSNVSTRRKWTSSSPIDLELKLKFESINDTFREVIQPCIGLQSLVLPRKGSLNVGGNSLSIIPPGPNPLRWSETVGSIPGALGFNDGTTTINIGNFVEFKSVIISSVRITYGTKMSKVGPVSAEALVRIQTYEMLLKEDLEAAYKLSSNAAPNNVSTGISQTINSGTNSNIDLGTIRVVK